MGESSSARRQAVFPERDAGRLGGELQRLLSLTQHHLRHAPLGAVIDLQDDAGDHARQEDKVGHQ